MLYLADLLKQDFILRFSYTDNLCLYPLLLTLEKNVILLAENVRRVYDPLDGGTYAFQNDIVGPMLLALLEDEAAYDSVATHDELKSSNGLPTRPIAIHAGLQPNNSPHLGTLVVFSYTFSVAKGIRDRMRVLGAHGKDAAPSVTVLITFIDTALSSHRGVQDALSTYMADYEEVIGYLSMWADIPVNVAFQADFFSNFSMPVLLNYMVRRHETLGRQLSPKYGSLALRSACPVPGCGLAEKHGRLNEYRADNNGQDSTITFYCPHHGPHAVRLSCPAETAHLEANAPTRNLLRSMTHLLDTTTHHIRVTGTDYAGVYQEMFLYRPLAACGAKLSKSLYVRDGAYEFMKRQGMDGFYSYARLRDRFGGDGSEGLRKIWDEVQRWMADPKELFRSFLVAYLHGVILRDV
ncbi:hypothetical protein HD806DRAFT_518299 [Xylariaceae sp. AK1471]|nr:hypothetical protein HD806DRAFT_518299 [Xylariaceae sp. AK1471]